MFLQIHIMSRQMSDLAINHIIVHELKKEKNVDPILNERDSVWNKENELVLELLSKLHLMYGKNDNRSQYGCFDKQTTSSFPPNAEDYILDDTRTDTSFISFTKFAMTLLKSEI